MSLCIKSFCAKTKTAQNSSGTVIARHLINLNPSLHVYQHVIAEIKRAKLIYTARTIVERGILPTVSKTHFTPLGRKKNFALKKRERGRRRKANESSFPVDTGSRRTGLRDGPVDRGKRPTFTHRNFRRDQPARFCLSADTKKRESVGARASSATPLLWYESPRFERVSPVRWLQSSSRRACATDSNFQPAQFQLTDSG